MAFIKESFLREKAKDYRLRALAESYIVKSVLQARITIFLSHSHKDRELAIGFQNLLAQYGINVYIDWQDSTLPDTPNRVTAETIKEKIKEMNLFILLTTNYALSSRWCPWEIGIADSFKDYDSILIVPIVDDLGEFKGNEYLQLYKRIEISFDKKPLVIEPEFRKYGTLLSESEVGYQGESLMSFIERKAGR